MQTSARFAKASEELDRIAQINQTGVSACWGHYNACPDEDASAMLATSIAFGLRQLHYLNRELLVLAIGTEMDNAQTELTNLVRPIEQLELFTD